jgi:acetyl-CoA synthetase
MLIQEELGARPAGLRAVLSGGEPLNPEVIEHIQRVWGLTLRDVYGQTETTVLVGNSTGQAIVPGCMGRPMPGFVVKLLDENGMEVEEGEIAVARDPPPLGLLQGYQQEDGTTAPAIWLCGGRTGGLASSAARTMSLNHPIIASVRSKSRVR